MKHQLTFLLLFCCTLTYAQQGLRDTLKTSTKPSLTLAGIYSSDVNYYGQTSVNRTPYGLGYIGLAFNSGIYFSGSVYKILNADEGTSGGSLTAGYDFNLTEKLTGGLSYTRSFFPDVSFFLQSENLNMFSAKLGYDFTWLNAGLNADYNPGENGALFTTFDVKKTIELIAFDESRYLSIEPAFEVVGSTQQITSTEEVPQSSGSTGIGFIKLPGQGGKQKPQYRTVQSTSFGILSYGLKLPVSYNTRKFTAEAAYQGFINSQEGQASSQGLRSILSLGLYYVL
ncbi:hypothetical protein [Daejeonella sp.]|uniref:hypothetical protein n=1 Tax=Daejeonella sp. TaxID=2805397 RepID=UPI0030BCA4E2